MKKQYLILLVVMGALFASLALASCQPAASGGGDASASAAASADAEASASADAEASASADAEAEASASADAAAAGDDGEFKSIPAFQPTDHEGRTYEQCPTCHDGSTAPAIPEDHFINGELDGSRLQCVTCHVVEPAA